MTQTDEASLAVPPPVPGKRRSLLRHPLRAYDVEGGDAEAGDAGSDLDVPDPYYGGPDAFAHALTLVERACRGLLASDAFASSLSAMMRRA